MSADAMNSSTDQPVEAPQTPTASRGHRVRNSLLVAVVAVMALLAGLALSTLGGVGANFSDQGGSDNSVSTPTFGMAVGSGHDTSLSWTVWPGSNVPAQVLDITNTSNQLNGDLSVSNLGTIDCGPNAPANVASKFTLSMTGLGSAQPIAAWSNTSMPLSSGMTPGQEVQIPVAINMIDEPGVDDNALQGLTCTTHWSFRLDQAHQQSGQSS